MGTPAIIGFKDKNGNFKITSVNYDGKVLLPILKKSYNTIEKLEDLIDLGNLSTLGNFIDPQGDEPHTYNAPQEDTVVAYHRDRGEKMHTFPTYRAKDLEELSTKLKKIAEQYIYIFDDGVWYFSKNYGETWTPKKETAEIKTESKLFESFVMNASKYMK